MKILTIYPAWGFFSGSGGQVGGHIAHIIGIYEAFKNLGHDVVIAGYDKPPFLKDAKFERLRPSGVPTGKLKKLMILHHGYREIIKVIEKIRPNAVYIRWSGILHMEKVHKKFSTVPIIAECNTPAELSMKSASPRWLMEKWGKQTDNGFVKASKMIVVVSDEIKNYFSNQYPEYPQKSVVTVPNGVNCEKFKPQKSNLRRQLDIPENVFLLGFTGNFAPWHRIDLIIKALSKMPEDVWFLLVGTGPRGIVGELKKLAHDTGCEERVIFAGVVPFVDMPAYITTCSTMIVTQDKNQPHRSPIKLYEYMASQKPAVGARVGQIAQTITDGENGLLCDPDSVDDLCEKIMFLKENPEMRKRLGENARKNAVEEHSWESRVEMILNNLHKLANNE